MVDRIKAKAVADQVANFPCAIAPLQSYRYPSRCGGFVMIGATGPEDALREARRSCDVAIPELLQVWDGRGYAPCRIGGQSNG